MAADGPGKYKGSKRRTAKPYDRPQGIFRRVTDSVTGLFGSLSGWLGTDDDGTEEAPAAPATSAPPGESFIFAQPPTTQRKPYRPIYPEEGEDVGEGPSTSISQVSAAPSGSGINLGASGSGSSSGTTSMAPTPLTRGLLGTTTTSLGHPLPLISSTPYDQPLRSRPLMRPTPTSLDSGTETPGTDFIMPPRRVGLDEETFTSLRLPIISEANKTSSPSANVIPSLEKMSSSPVIAMPSLEETQRKRAREIDIDHNSSLGGDSISNRSLFSETGSRASQPQMPGSSKKPRFNVSAFSASPVMGERSLLSDSTSRPSPFYPWRTAYGGASANKRNRYQNRLQPNRAQIKPKPPPSDASAEDGGLSQAARRILDCLNNMSTPISDAKRIPTPSPGQRGSFLDSSYTATYYKHRPPSRNSGPPVTKLLTPTKAVVQPNLSKLIAGGSSGEGSTSTVAETSHVISTSAKSTQDTTAISTLEDVAPASKPQEDPSSIKPSQDSSSLPKQQEQTSNMQPSSTSASSVSKPLATEVISKSTTETSTFSFKSTTESSSAQPLFRFGEGNKPTEASSAEKPLFRFGNGDSSSHENSDKDSSAIISSRPSIHSSEPIVAIVKGGGGKLKTKISDTGRASRREEEDDETPVPALPTVSLTMSSLPKINFTATQTNAVIASSQSLTTTGFTFSAPQTISESPKAALKSFDGSIASNELEFTFSTPQNLLNDGSPKVNHTPGGPMFNSVSSNFQPKLKSSASKSKLNAAAPLKEGSILDILKSNKVNTSLNEETTKVSESSVVTKNTNSLEQFMKKSDEWSCDTCMVTNKNISEKCVSCETPKPGVSTKEAAKMSSNLTPAVPVVTNSLSAFMKKSNEWTCDTCMLSNTSSDKCVACESPKPGSAPKTSVSSSLPLTSSNSSFNAPSTFNAPVGFNFQKSSSEWECSECLVRNKDNAETCICCQSAKPGTKTQQSSVFSSGLSSNNSLANNTDWKCETCLVQNTKDTKKCKECDTAKPSAVIGSQVITGNFKFGVGNTSANDSSSGSFKFGVSNSSATETVSSGFSFGVNPSSGNKDSITTSTEFSFGIKPVEGESSSATTGFKFGTDSAENKIEDKKTESGGEFSFTMPQKPAGEKTEVSFSNADTNKTEDKLDSISKPAFSFGSATGGFTFGGNANGKKNVEKPSKEENSNVCIENKKESENTAFAFSFGSKPTENDVTSQKPAFSFSNSSKDTSSIMVNSSETFSFSSPKGDEKLKTSAPTFTFGAKPAESSSLPFGGNAIPKANADVPTTNATFTFGSTVTTKEETKSPFGGKRDSSSCDEPARKLPFGTSNSANSGVGNSTTSLFSFGSNNSKSGPGFGASPASNPPAFGSPAPVVSAANPTPSFSFNSTAPATTPAFGSPAPTPMFGQGFGVPNNNNNNPSFAFGQPTEKKASTGFDFGQATPNSSSPAFNFASSEPASGPGLFQFGQTQPNNTNTGGSAMFQFGSGAPTATQTSSFGAGGDNIFSGARSAGGQPDRRIKKKAVRRIPK